MSSVISIGKKRNLFSCLILLLTVFGINTVYSQDPVPFTCNGSAYLVSSPGGTTPSTMYIVQANNPNIVNATITPSIADRYNGIGYNFEDNFIYGMAAGDTPSLTGADIVRIDAEGTVTRLGAPQRTPGQSPGLATWTSNVNVNPNGGRISIAPGVVGLDNKMYTMAVTNSGAAFLVTVDLTTMRYTTVRLSRDINVADLAFSPYNGFLYGIAGGNLIRINPNNGNQAFINPSSGTVPGVHAGGAWNDVQGRVYFYSNSANTANGGGRLYRYNPANNAFVNVRAVDPYPTFDATACFPTRLEKQVSIPTEGLVPGDEVEFEFSIYNNQMLPITYDFEDILASSDLSWVSGSVEPASPGGGTVSISGQTLTISGVTAQPTAATGEPLTFRVSVKVADNAAYGSCYSNQATITQGGTTVVSDNPETEEPNDPTLFCLNECELPAPGSGGNIQQCANDPVQKITATATVPDGVQLIWYDAPAGGNVVADPSLEAVGSVTYYAAADDGTCISENRTPVTLHLLPTPQLDGIEDVEECVSYELPEITGNNLTGNEAYYTEPDGGGTRYLPGDVIEDIGNTTLYVYDEMEAGDNCEGDLTVASNTAYVIDNLFEDGTHHQYPGATNPGFWQGTANQQILYDSPGTPTGGQIYLGLVGDVSIDDTSACFGTEVNINAQVTVTNQGPGTGAGYSGRLAIIDKSTDQILYQTPLTVNFPANTTMTPTVSGIVSAAEVLAGNIAVMMAVETYQGSFKNWQFSGFSADYQFQPESTQACSDEQSFELTINDLPELLITDPDPVCLPGTVDLTDAAVTAGSTPGLIFTYFEDAEGTVALSNPESISETGTYYILGEDPVTGCSTIMPVEVVLIDAPEVSIGQPVCIDGEGSIEVTSPLGAEFEYSIDGTNYQIDAVFESVAPGTYMVTVRNTTTGCVSLETEAVVDEAPTAPEPVVTQPDCESPTGTIHIPRYENAMYSIDGGANFSGLNTFSELDPGDYEVVIRADGCDTDPVPVTIEEAPPVPAAPVSGGDEIVCAESPVQTLTATASVEAGQTLTWYDAPVGGNVVPDPSLNTVGVVTYYAEADNGTCPSLDRTAVTLMIQQAPQLDPAEDQEACEEYMLPEIEGSDLSGNEAYFTEPGGGGTRLEAGDTINTIGTTTLYIYDEVEGEFNCSGTLSAQNSTEITQSDVEVIRNRATYLTDDFDPAVWNDSPTEINYDTGDPVVNSQTYKAIAADVVFAGEPGCFGSAIRINPRMQITNTGPDTGRAYSGEVAVVNNLTNEVIARSQQLLNTPVNTPVAIDFTTTVSMDDLTGGNISVVIIVETYHTDDNIKDWRIENFSVDYQYLPEFTPSCPDEESFDVTIYETPTPEAGEEQTQYNNGTFTLDATTPALGTGEWSVVDGTLAGAISDINDPNATVTLDANTSVTLRWTVTNGTCTAFDDVVVNYVSQADIVTEKVTNEAGQTTYVPGETVEYTITIRNNGPSDAEQVRVVDVDPAGAEIAGWTAEVVAGAVTLPNASGTGSIDETIDLLPADAEVMYHVTVQTLPRSMEELVNTVQVTGPTPDPDPDCEFCETPPLSPDPQADIVTVKTTSDAGQTEYVQGEAVDYTIAVTNNGPSEAQQVNVTDMAPAGTTITNWTAEVTAGTVTLPNTSGTGDINETIGTLPDGAVVTYTVTVQTPPDFTDDLVNAVQVTSPTEDPDPDCPDCVTPPLEMTPEPSIALVKTGAYADSNNNGMADAGDGITYTFTVTNTGNVTIDNITIDDDLTGTAGLSLTPPALAPDETGTATVAYTITQSDVDNGGVSNQALATGASPDGDPVEDTSGTGEDNDTPTETPIEQSPSIALVKTGAYADSNNNGMADAGDEITYTFTVTNTGNVTVSDITIDDSLTGTNNLPIAPATLTPGATGTATATYTITQSDVDNGGVSNQALATGNDPNGDPVEDESGTGEDNDDPTDTPLTQDPSIALVKAVTNTGSGENGAFVVGDAIEYTFTVTNTGNVTVSDINIDDALTDTSGLPVTPSTLAPGESGTATATYTITQADVDNGGVSNQALATGQDPGGDPIEDESGTGEDNDDPTETPITQEPSITLVKSVTNTGSGENGAFVVGDAIEYTFTVTNTGNVTVDNITIDDELTGSIGLPITPTTLAPGEIGTATTTYTIIQSDVDNGGVSNQALATGEDPNGDPIEDESGTDEDNDDPTDTPITQEPSIALVKAVTNTGSGDNNAFVVGDVIEYTFTVTNTGNVTVSDITIDDALTGTAGLPITPATLAPGESGTATATYTIIQSDVDNGGVSNQALATGEAPNGDPIEDESGTGEDNDDPTDTPITQDPSIALVKSVTNTGSGANGAFVVGDAIEYTFTVTNTGNVTVDNITIDDDLTGSIGLPITPTALAPGEIGTATATYTITQEDVDNGGVSNQALATGEDPNDDPIEDESGTGEDNDDPTDTPITQDPSIALVKTVTNTGSGANDAFVVGDAIEYTFTVTNTGNVTVADITIDDALTGTAGLPITPATLVPGESGTATVMYTITQSDVDNGGVSNQALAGGQDPNGDPIEDESGTGEDNDDPTETPIEQTPAIVLVKTGEYADTNNNQMADAGDEITYTFTVTNTGNVTVADITVDDDLTETVGLPITPAILAPGEEGTVTATYTITRADVDSGGVSNQALAAGEDPNGDPVEDTSGTDPDNDEPTETPIEQNPDMILYKAGGYVDENGDGTVSPGDIIQYSFTVENTGNVTLSNISISDETLVPALEVSEVNPSALAPGETATASAVYVITQEDINTGAVYNIAEAGAETPDGEELFEESQPSELLDPSDPFYMDECPDCTVVKLERNPAITLLKTGAFNDEDGDGQAQAGETITYGFVVTNTGNVFLDNIEIEDPLPGISITGGPISLLPGESDDTTFSGTYTITQADIIARGVTNQATVHADATDGSRVSNLSDSADGLGDHPTFTALEGCTIEVFNGLSPNGDGLNDTFRIQGIECYPDNTVEIYNRWGIKVYDTRGYDNSSSVFRGYSEGRATLNNGKRLPAGTYFYLLKYRTENGSVEEKSGYLYIN
ncbi:DUF11 domain-containing protein [Sinomicrobium kalidii]|uniref:DUF7507 domain-containing protein n=1 Tax=Sinomicrobium kalidii TaxID=2900738 RepID=UPI001E28DB9B|nr:gliding motility-associated C-terminal domain-containing protein [Sinomicrobium kalidii]UGU16519.1 DUF11 domain-containing protein [Sinomicrobium kalidii]